jgi:hypothetical protein
MRIYYRGDQIAFTELKERVPKSPELSLSAPRPIVIRKARKDHPWRQEYQNMQPRVPTLRVAAPLVGMRTHASPYYRASLQYAFQREQTTEKGTFLNSFSPILTACKADISRANSTGHLMC